VIAGVTLWPEYLIDFTLAYVFRILFQYFAIKPMGNLSSRQAISDAVQAETLSIVAFEAGMFGWMALVYFVLFTNPHINPDHAGYWLMMQIAASIGLATSNCAVARSWRYGCEGRVSVQST
jgi:hypothetical protein